MSTNQARLDLRPQLSLAPASAIIAVFAQFLTKRKVKLDQLPANQRWEKIKELVTRDNRLRGLLFGMAIGQFTTDEIAHYLENEGDTNRRMTNLLTERLLSVYG